MTTIARTGSVTPLVVTVVVGYGVLAYAAIAPGLNPAGALMGLVLTLAVLGVQLGYVSRPDVRRSREGTALALAALVCLVVAPVVALGVGWVALAGFLAGSLLVLLPSRIALGACGVVVVGVGVVVATAGAPVLSVVTAAAGTLVTALVIHGLTRLWAMTTELRTPNPPSVTEAVEPAATSSPEPAPSSPAPLVAALDAARTDLTDADVEFSVLGEDVDLPEEAGAVFAELLRVAVRHTTRHIGATSCHVTIVRRAAEARIVVAHDGAFEDPDPADFEALGERFDAADGSVLAERDEGEFTVDGRLPLSVSAAPSSP